LHNFKEKIVGVGVKRAKDKHIQSVLVNGVFCEEYNVTKSTDNSVVVLKDGSIIRIAQFLESNGQVFATVANFKEGTLYSLSRVPVTHITGPALMLNHASGKTDPVEILKCHSLLLR